MVIMISLYLLSSNAIAGAQEVSSRIKKLYAKPLKYGSFSDGPEEVFIENMRDELSDIHKLVYELEKSKSKLEEDLQREKLRNKYMEGITVAKADLSERIDDLKEDISNLRFLINKSPYFNNNALLSELNINLLKIYDGINSLGEIKGASQLNASLSNISENIKNLKKGKIPPDQSEDSSDIDEDVIKNFPFYFPFYFAKEKKKYKLVVTFSQGDEIHAYQYYDITIEYSDPGNVDDCPESEDSTEQNYKSCRIIWVAEDIKYSDFYINGTPDTIIKPPPKGTNKAIFKVAFTSKRTHKVQVGLHGYGDIRPLAYEYNCVDDISYHIIEYFLDWLRNHLILGIALIAQLITNVALIYTTLLKVSSKSNRKKAKAHKTLL